MDRLRFEFAKWQITPIDDALWKSMDNQPPSPLSIMMGGRLVKKNKTIDSCRFAQCRRRTHCFAVNATSVRSSSAAQVGSMLKHGASRFFEGSHRQIQNPPHPITATVSRKVGFEGRNTGASIEHRPAVNFRPGLEFGTVRALSSLRVK